MGDVWQVQVDKDGQPVYCQSSTSETTTIKPSSSTARFVDATDPSKPFDFSQVKSSSASAREAVVKTATAAITHLGQVLTTAALHYHDTSIPPDRMTPYPDVNLRKMEKLEPDLIHLSLLNFFERFSRDPDKPLITDIAHWQPHPLRTPILQSTNKQNETAALSSFRLILDYNQASQIATAHSLFSGLSESPGLVDEVCFQLLKQSEANPRPLPVWELIVAFVTLFAPARPHWIWLKAHCLRHWNDDDASVASAARLAFIRFATKCAAQPSRPIVPTVDIVAGLIRDAADGQCWYGSSVYEQMHFQAKIAPHCPVPLFLPRVGGALLARGAATREGIFRVPGSLRRIQEIAAELNGGGGGDSLATAHINDLAYLFKAWFGDLPIAVIPPEYVDDLLELGQAQEKYLPFVERIPPLHRAVLAFLAGFLRQIAQTADVTRMTVRFLAMCFGYKLLPPETPMAADLEKRRDLAVDFLETIIKQMDTSGIYPLPPGAVPQ
jgi:hypothetical protein